MIDNQLSWRSWTPRAAKGDRPRDENSTEGELSLRTERVFQMPPGHWSLWPILSGRKRSRGVECVFRIHLKTALPVLQNIVVAFRMLSVGPWDISWEKYNLRKINGPVRMRCSLFLGTRLRRRLHFCLFDSSVGNSFIALISPVYESLVQFNPNLFTRMRVCHKNIQII